MPKRSYVPQAKKNIIKKKKKTAKKTVRIRRGTKLKLGHIIDGVSTTLLSKKQLKEYCRRVSSENAIERKQAASFKMERDRIRAYFGISRNALEEVRVKFRNAESYFEDTVEQCEIELTALKHKVNHVFYDQKNELAELQIDTLTHLKLAFTKYLQEERELQLDNRFTRALNEESSTNSKQCLKFLRLEYAGEIHQLRQLLTQELFLMDQIFDRKFTKHRNMLNKQQSAEIKELTIRKNEEIQEVLKNNEAEMVKLRNYFCDIAMNNWSLIGRLKSKMEKLRVQNECISNQLEEVLLERESIVKPLEESQREIIQYKDDLKSYRRDKILLAKTKSELKSVKAQMERFKWQHMVLEMRVEQVETEKKVLEERLFKALLEVERKTAVKTALYDAKIARMHQQNEVRNCVIGELKRLDERPIGDNKELDRILDDKDDMVHTIKYDLVRIRKAHHDLLSTYQEKMRKHSLPQSELGFVPLKILPKLLTVKKTKRVSFIEIWRNY